MADFYSILDVSVVWKVLGALWPGDVERARCLLVSPRALQGRRLELYELRRRQRMADFYSILDVPVLWKMLGALWPGEVGLLKWRARCLLVSPRALQGQRLVLYQLRSQQEIDDGYWCWHSSCESLLTYTQTIYSLPSWMDTDWDEAN